MCIDGVRGLQEADVHLTVWAEAHQGLEESGVVQLPALEWSLVLQPFSDEVLDSDLLGHIRDEHRGVVSDVVSVDVGEREVAEGSVPRNDELIRAQQLQPATAAAFDLRTVRDYE
jgi:hypothetical protein